MKTNLYGPEDLYFDKIRKSTAKQTKKNTN